MIGNKDEIKHGTTLVCDVKGILFSPSFSFTTTEESNFGNIVTVTWANSVLNLKEEKEIST